MITAIIMMLIMFNAITFMFFLLRLRAIRVLSPNKKTPEPFGAGVLVPVGVALKGTVSPAA